jgi:hypothetical protein
VVLGDDDPALAGLRGGDKRPTSTGVIEYRSMTRARMPRRAS